MNNTDMISAISGIPSGKRKTRRGNRRKAGPVGKPHEHLANATAAIKANDHGTARKHGFAFIRSLQTAAAKPDEAESQAEAAMESPAMEAAEASPTEGQNAGSSLGSRLAGILAMKRKGG